MALPEIHQEGENQNLTGPLATAAPALSGALQTSWLYVDPNAPMRTSWSIPADVPYNREMDGQQYTFMTGQAYRNLCAQKGLRLRSFNRWDDDALHIHISWIFDVTLPEAEELCMKRSTNNALHIQKKLNNLDPMGLQRINGAHGFEDFFFCWLPFIVDDRVACAKVSSDGYGSLLHTSETGARVAILP